MTRVKDGRVAPAAVLLLLFAAAAPADLFVWTPAGVDTLIPLGGEFPVLYVLSQSMGYGYSVHLALVDHMGTGLPDSFCVFGEVLVEPDDYLDTLEACGLQPLLEGPLPVLDMERSGLPDTLELLLVDFPFRAEPDTAIGLWILTDGRYIRMEGP